jgi:hypothetical protein
MPMSIWALQIFLGAKTGRRLQNRLADLSGPVGQSQSIIDFYVAVFGFGGFANVYHFAIQAMNACRTWQTRHAL